MNTKTVFKKLFNFIEEGDMVRIKGTSIEGLVVRIAILDGLTIVYIDTGDVHLTKVYDLKRWELV